MGKLKVGQTLSGDQLEEAGFSIDSDVRYGERNVCVNDGTLFYLAADAGNDNYEILRLMKDENDYCEKHFSYLDVDDNGHAHVTHFQIEGENFDSWCEETADAQDVWDSNLAAKDALTALEVRLKDLSREMAACRIFMSALSKIA